MKILPYNEEALAASLSNLYTSTDLIKAKNHFTYLSKYLGPDGLDAKTILIEDDYISKDYLHDYASYYALCFEKYPKVCKRVHFFNKEIKTRSFHAAMLRDPENNKQFWSNYLGFIVIKPIPAKPIGYTVLRTYAPEPGFIREFWGLRDYKIHLFGNEVTLKSLAFQEQDSVLAACATTAIWSMLNKAALDFHTILKSPSEITKDAATMSHDGSRLFPNKGLIVSQLCQAIVNSGLVSEVKRENDTGSYRGQQLKVITNQYLKKILNAYAPIGIPIILVIKVPNGDTHGIHAITVTGFKRKELATVAPAAELITNFASDNIVSLYAHDDQWGPFARINLQNTFELLTPWNEGDRTQPATLVTHMIVPVYPKIRITYEDVEAIVLGLDQVLKFFFGKLIKSLRADIVWDIKIDFSEHFKAETKSSVLDYHYKIDILSKSLPKYIWTATCYIKEDLLFTFVLDATNVNTAMLGVKIISFVDSGTQKELKEFLELNLDKIEAMFKNRSSVEFWISELKKSLLLSSD